MARTRKTSPTATTADPVTESQGAAPVNTDYLQTLVGYNARRTALTVISTFLERMAVYELRPVDFSVMSVITHNPGITSRQLCACLGLLPPNLVTMLNQLEKRGLVQRQPHPHDGRAVALSATPQGQALMAKAEATAYDLETEVTSGLTATQRQTLIKLLKMVYQPPEKKSTRRASSEG